MEPYKFSIGQSVVIDILCEFVGMRGTVKDRARQIIIAVDGDDGDCVHEEMACDQYLVKVGNHEEWYAEQDLARYVEPFKEER
mgnify:CR=1 FL=1